MKFTKTVLPSGIRLVTIPMADNPSVAVLLMVEAGSKYETKEINGISHFLEHMVFKGTPKRPKASEIAKELDGLGAQYNAFTGQEVTGYWVKVDSRHLDAALNIVSDMYLNPLLDEKEMTKEKGVIVEEIRMYKDLPQHHVHEIMNELLYGDQPAGWDIAGTEATVKSYTRADLVNYRNQHYVGKKTVVMVAGSFNEKDIVEKVSAAFAGILDAPKKAKLPIIEAQTEPAIAVQHKETDQTHLVIGLRSFSITDKRLPVMHVMSTILGKGMSSRLFTRMRDDLGICYYVRTSHNPSTDHGLLDISAGVDNSRVEEAVREILVQCARLKNELVPPEELKKAKDYISGTTMLELETSEARAEFAGAEELFKGEIETPDAALKKVNAVTAEDIRNLARQIFVNEGLNLALIGRTPKDKLTPILRFEN